MNYKPDEGMLMAYLYGELDAAETEKMQLYLQQHPEELKELQRMGDVRSVIAHIQDKEVIAPPIFMGETNVKPLWQSRYFKTVMSIAASLLFLMVAGKFLGTEINYSGGELKISFGGKHELEKK